MLGSEEAQLALRHEETIMNDSFVTATSILEKNLGFLSSVLNEV